MNFRGISIPVSKKIKSIDQGIIGTCQEEIIKAIRSEFLTAFKFNKLSIVVVHQLSLECVLIQVDVMDELDSEQIKGATLFVVNFTTECSQLYVINLMNLRHEISQVAHNLKIIEPGSTKNYHIKSARVFFESASSCVALVTRIRSVLLIKYESTDGDVENLLVPGKDNEMVLTGTREAATGKLFYFPVTTQPA